MATARVLGTDFIVTFGNPNNNIKKWFIQTKDTVDAGDTIAITLADYGIAANGLLAVKGWKHTTNSSVCVTEAVTSAVASGVLTITIPVGTDNDARIIEIVGKGKNPNYSTIQKSD